MATEVFDEDHDRFAEGQVVKATKLSQEFDYKAFRERYGEDALILFVVTESGALVVSTAEKAPSPKPGQTLICLVDPRLAVTVETEIIMKVVAVAAAQVMLKTEIMEIMEVI